MSLLRFFIQTTGEAIRVDTDVCFGFRIKIICLPFFILSYCHKINSVREHLDNEVNGNREKHGLSSQC